MAIYARALTEDERARLEEWQAGSTARPALQQRATVILLSSQGYKTTEIADQVMLHPLNVRKWIHRFNEKGLAGLHDQPRCGRPPKINLNLRQLVWEIVSTDPRDLGCTYDKWTATNLMYYLRQVGLIDGLSYETVRQLFREAQVVVGQFGHRLSPRPAASRPHPQRKRERRPVTALTAAAGTT